MYNDVYQQNAEDDPPSTHQPCSYAAEWKNVNVAALILCAQGRLAVRRNACRWRGSTLAGPDSDTEMMFPVFWNISGLPNELKNDKDTLKSHGSVLDVFIWGSIWGPALSWNWITWNPKQQPVLQVLAAGQWFHTFPILSLFTGSKYDIWPTPKLQIHYSILS